VLRVDAFNVLLLRGLEWSMPGRNPPKQANKAALDESDLHPVEREYLPLKIAGGEPLARGLSPTAGRGRDSEIPMGL
jgi:hypothetical protein